MRYRKLLLVLVSFLIAGMLATNCSQPTPQVVEKEIPVEKVVKETVIVEKEVPVERVIKETVIVEKPITVEKIVTATPAVITLTDDAGRNVQVSTKVERIVSLAPSNTEILFALGLGDKVVGVTDFCDYPPEAQGKEKIGGIEPNMEKVVALSPDLVLAIGGSPVVASIGGNVELLAKFEELKLPTLILAPKDLEGVLADIELVGKATGAQQAAAKLVADMRAKVDQVLAKTKDVTQRPKVFYELDATDPGKPWTPGPGSWHDTFISMAGGVNVAAGAKAAWAQLSTEEIIKENPDLIILGDANWGVNAEAVKSRSGWGAIKAVKQDAIYPIDDNLISRPGPRLADGLVALAKIIHPELFK